MLLKRADEAASMLGVERLRGVTRRLIEQDLSASDQGAAGGSRCRRRSGRRRKTLWLSRARSNFSVRSSRLEHARAGTG
jgi:hypothetical protein